MNGVQCEGGMVRGKPVLRKQVPLKTPLRAAFPSPGPPCPGLSLRSSESAVLESRAQLPRPPVALRLWPRTCIPAVSMETGDDGRHRVSGLYTGFSGGGDCCHQWCYLSWSQKRPVWVPISE